MTDRITIADARNVSGAKFLEAFLGPYDRSPIYEQCIRAIRRGDTYGYPPMMVEHCRKLMAEQGTILDLETRRNDDGSYTVAA